MGTRTGTGARTGAKAARWLPVLLIAGLLAGAPPPLAAQTFAPPASVPQLDPGSAPLGGGYKVEGSLPPGPNGVVQRYTGLAGVVARGGVYDVRWVIGRTEYIGTGIRDGDSLAVIYRTAQDPTPGLVLYHLRPDGSWAGGFTTLGGEKLGYEVWVPVRP